MCTVGERKDETVAEKEKERMKERDSERKFGREADRRDSEIPSFWSPEDGCRTQADCWDFAIDLTYGNPSSIYSDYGNEFPTTPSSLLSV